jgi:deoxyribonuclease IV
MHCFGSHVSCAGGLLQAIVRAKELECQCIQIFVSTPRAWPSYSKLIPLMKPKKSSDSKNRPDDLPDEDCGEFKKSLKEAGLSSPIAHTTYLINLGSSDPVQWQRSLDALVVEWRRSDQLELSGLVMHPGAHGEATPGVGLTNIVRGLKAALQLVNPKCCPLLLENTAGQGTCLGWKAEQLGYLLREIDSPNVAVCWDTCHALAAGYDFRTAAGMKSMVAALKEHGVMDHIRAVHINDSVKDCGSRVDRHEHIGAGCIGDEGFRLFLNSPQFKSLPMYLETEKGDDEGGVDWDLKNLAKLRSLVSS